MNLKAQDSSPGLYFVQVECPQKRAVASQKLIIN